MATSSNGSIGEVVSDLPAASTSSPVIEDASSRSTDLPAPKSQQQPLFSNPFMAPFLPQTAQLHPLLRDSFEGGGGVHMTDPATIPLQSQGGSDEIAIGEGLGAEFRVNPLTGGYFLSPNQYQDMMQQYVQGLMLAAHGQEQNALSEGDKKSRATSLNSELNDAFGMGPTIHSQQSTSSSSLLSSFTVDPEKVASSIALLDVQSSVSEHKIDSAVPLTILSETTSPQPLPENKSEHRSSTSPPSQGTVQQMCPVSNMTEVVETVRQEMESTSLPEEHPVIGEEDSQMIVGQIQNGLPQDEAQAKALEEPEIVEQEDQKAATVAKKAAPSSHNHMQHDQRTSELIKKQINEIEREISRRIQNKNVKKMDEAELAQLLSDHGFGNFVGFANTPLLADQSAIPYRPSASSTSEDISESTKASLNQLRSSFSPPPHHLEGEPTGSGGGPFTMPQTTPPPPPPPHQHYFAGGATNGGVPSPFGQLYHPTQHHQVQQMPAVASPFYGAALQQHLPQHQQFYQQQHPSRFGGMVNNNGAGQPSSTPPIMSNISVEMAAALLQQLQQQNPGLIQNLVEQQHQMQYNNTGGAAAQNTPGPAMIPAPPLPINNVSRKTNGTQQQQPPNNLNRKLSAGSTTSSTTSKSTVRSVGHARGTLDENGWFDISKRHGSFSNTSSQGSSNTPTQPETSNGAGEDKENGTDPVWVMRDSYLKRLQREEQRDKELISSENEEGDEEKSGSARHANGEVGDTNEELQETDKLLIKQGDQEEEDGKVSVAGVLPTTKKSSTNKKEVMVHEPAVLIEGVLFRARYLGSTQLVCDGRPTNCRTSRMAQAQEAVARVKAPDGEIQPSTEIDLFISTEKIMVLNTDLQDILMDHSLRSISYIADIGDLVVLMARRVPQATDTLPSTMAGSEEDEESETIRRAPRVVCHVFESEEASFIAQSIGQAFQVAYVEFLRANGIDDPAYLREIDYQEVLNSQELMGEELEMFARKETQKDVVVPKKVGEALGVVVVESGWGSMLPTVVVANMAPGGPASRSNQLNIGDQIIAINGISLVGLPLASAQQNIKNAKTSTAVRLTIVSTPPVVEVRIKRPDTKYQLGFSVQNGVICSLLRGGIAERGGIRVGHRIIEINHLSVVAVPHERIVNMLATATGEIHMKTMPTSMFRLLTGQEVPNYI